MCSYRSSGELRLSSGRHDLLAQVPGESWHGTDTDRFADNANSSVNVPGFHRADAASSCKTARERLQSGIGNRPVYREKTGTALPNVCKRIKNTVSQTGLPWKERKKNIPGGIFLRNGFDGKTHRRTG